MNREEARKLLKDNLEFLQTLSTKDNLIYRKLKYFNTSSFRQWYYENRHKINSVKNKIWTPKDINDYLNLNVKVIPVNDQNTNFIWTVLRTFVHSAMWAQNPGRHQRFLVIHEDKFTNLLGATQRDWKYLGIISLGSDFISVGGRDEHIGWEREQRLSEKLKHTCMASTIAPTQPLGYNYLGGKLIALMSCSDIVVNTWDSRYKEKLVGITTTSLYGGFSQYNNLKYWRKCKSTEGKIPLEPSEDVYEILRDWLLKNYTIDLNPNNKEIITHSKGRVLSILGEKLDITFPVNNFPRGVYWCALYNNSNKFLRCEDDMLDNKRFDNSVNSLVELWRDRYAKKRIEKVEFDNNVVFYDYLIGKGWEDVRGGI